MRKIGICLNRIGLLLLCLCTVISLSSCTAPDGALTRFEQTHVGLFDTAYTFIAYLPDRASFDRLDAALYDKLERYHQLFDVYHAYNGLTNLYTINAAGGEAKEADPAITELLSLGLRVYDQTHGAVDITCGALCALWKTYRDAATRLEDPVAAIPDGSEIADALARKDIAALTLAGDRVRLTAPGMTLDVGAIAKGYAARQAMAFLQENGVTSAMLNLGGTVCTLGTKADTDEPWGVGVTDPDHSDTYRLVLNLRGECAATSGDYERYYEVDGVRYCHILNTQTGYPADTVRAVTVISRDAAQADALSTALFVLPVDEGRRLIEDTPNTEALWIKPDGTVLFSSGCEAYIRSGS